MIQAHRSGFLFNTAFVGSSQAGFVADFQIRQLGDYAGAFAEGVLTADNDLVEFIHQFFAAVHALGRPAVCVSNAWGNIAEFVADGYRCINHFHGFLFACVGSDVTTLVLIKIIGEIA